MFQLDTWSSDILVDKIDGVKCTVLKFQLALLITRVRAYTSDQYHLTFDKSLNAPNDAVFIPCFAIRTVSLRIASDQLRTLLHSVSRSSNKSRALSAFLLLAVMRQIRAPPGIVPLSQPTAPPHPTLTHAIILHLQLPSSSLSSSQKRINASNSLDDSKEHYQSSNGCEDGNND